jgi:hypothetical protein
MRGEMNTVVRFGMMLLSSHKASGETMKPSLSITSAMLLLTVTACDQNSLTKEQSETAGFCVTYLMLADNPDHTTLGAQIAEHVEGRFRKEGLEAGVKRASHSIERDGGAARPTLGHIDLCEEVMMW